MLIHHVEQGTYPQRICRKGDTILSFINNGAVKVVEIVPDFTFFRNDRLDQIIQGRPMMGYLPPLHAQGDRVIFRIG